MKMTTIHLGRGSVEEEQEEKMITGNQGLNGEEATKRDKVVQLYIDIKAKCV